MSKISAILSGVSGEHFVAAELSRRGYIASLTSKNTKGIDLLASNEDASKTVGIQVKTNQGVRKSWLVSEKSENYYSDNLFYVFVNLKDLEQPDFYIVPSTIVAKDVKKAHQDWLETPGQSGQKHNDTSMRMFHDLNDLYLGKWELLGLG